MSSAYVRGLATAVLAVGLCGAALYVFANRAPGTFGFTSTFLYERALVRVDAVTPGSVAQKAGLRVGDLLSPLTPSFADRSRLYLFGNPPLVAVGDRADVVRSRGVFNRTVLMIAAPDPNSPRFEALYFTILSIPLLWLGWYVIWRRPDSADAVALGCMLLLLGLWNAGPDRVGPLIARLVVYQIVGSACATLGVFAAAVFFARYPEGQGTRVSPLRRAMLWLVMIVTAMELIGLTLFFVLPAFVGNVPLLYFVATWFAIVPPCAAFVCLVDGFRHGDATERARLRWLGATFFLGISGPLFIPVATYLLGSQFTVVDQVLLESTLFILAFGVAYGILRRRVIDVPFVLNRALVFSAVSGIVVALFIGVEWLVGIVFVNVSRPTSFAIEVGGAIAIGISLRPIHGRVDHTIDRLFFAKRHAAESALRHLTTEIHFIRDRTTLVERITRDVTAHLEATFVALYFRQGVNDDFTLLHGTAAVPSRIDADDDAAVALAVDEAPVALHSRKTALRGEIAVPLAVRKRLVGMLVLGDKATGGAFAPDEIELVRSLCAYLGTALASHAAQDASSNSERILLQIVAEMRLQREEMRRLREALGAARFLQ